MKLLILTIHLGLLAHEQAEQAEYAEQAESHRCGEKATRVESLDGLQAELHLLAAEAKRKSDKLKQVRTTVCGVVSSRFSVGFFFFFCLLLVF
jgi:hypothetical protein